MVEIKTDKEFYVGENLSGIITVTVSPELKEAVIRLDFELPSGEKFCSPTLESVDENNQTQYAVPQQCLDRMGESHIQAIATLDGYIEKSNVLHIPINKSINAVEDFAEAEPDLMASLLNEFEETKETVEVLGKQITNPVTIKSWYSEDGEQ